jgi:DNA primase
MSKKVDQIRSTLKIREVMEYYGVKWNSKGFANCPFHNEKTPSLTTWENRYKCFGCGESGDVIDFVMAFHNISFKQAIIRLDSDFNLGLKPKKLKYRERVQEDEDSLMELAFNKWEESLHQDYLTLCEVHEILFRRVIYGELWLKKYQERLETLLDTFDFQEARKWKTIWK